VLNALVNLGHLTLYFDSSYFDGRGWGHMPDHPLRLTELKILYWHHMNNDDGLFAFLFLSRCELGPQCLLWLDASETEHAENMHLLCPFFT
jgi:hypothetical protein